MTTNCSFSSPLSPKQKTIWSLILKGHSVSAIAEKLSTTRQYVNQTRLTADAKLSSTLLEVARVNDLQIIRVHAKEGILVGFHPALKRKAVVTYSSTYGIKIWYWHDNPEEVSNSEFLRQTRIYLLDLAKERGIAVENFAEMHPAKLAHEIFGRLAPEVKT
jgi:hypothetical protein